MVPGHIMRIEDRIKEAIPRLMAARSIDGRVRVNVPVVYPSGTTAAVEIMANGDDIFVSDIALGHCEAEMYGAQEYYDGSAKISAERFGVGFDGLSIFKTWTSMGRLEGAIVAVANASVQAASAAIFKAVEEKEKRTNAELFERVVEVFGKHLVSKTATLAGRDASWDAHNVVVFPNRRRAVFEFVSPNTNSISNKFMMFSDLTRGGADVSLNSVVKRVEELGPKGSMLADVSNVLPISASAEDFRKYARAA